MLAWHLIRNIYVREDTSKKLKKKKRQKRRRQRNTKRKKSHRKQINVNIHGAAVGAATFFFVFFFSFLSFNGWAKIDALNRKIAIYPKLISFSIFFFHSIFFAFAFPQYMMEVVMGSLKFTAFYSGRCYFNLRMKIWTVQHHR